MWQVEAYAPGNIQRELVSGKWAAVRYEVKAVAESDLPAGVEWAWARVPDGLFLFVKSHVFDTPDVVSAVLSRAIAARMTCEGDPWKPSLSLVG